MKRKCKRLVTVRVYLPEDEPWTKTLRMIIASNGKIIYKDEITRRIVFLIKPSALLDKDLNLRGASYEYRIICKKSLKIKKNFKIINKTETYAIAHAIISGRYILIEIKNNEIIIKIGKRTTSNTPPRILPPSAFTLNLEDVEEIEKIYKIIKKSVIGGGNADRGG